MVAAIGGPVLEIGPFTLWLCGNAPIVAAAQFFLPQQMPLANLCQVLVTLSGHPYGALFPLLSSSDFVPCSKW